MERVPILVDTRGAAELLALSPGTLKNWRSQGRGPRYVIGPGGLVRYRPADLREWAEAAFTYA